MSPVSGSYRINCTLVKDRMVGAKIARLVFGSLIVYCSYSCLQLWTPFIDEKLQVHHAGRYIPKSMMNAL